MRQRWIKFDWSIAVVLSMLLHSSIVYWMLHEQIRALTGILRQGVAAQWLAYRHQPNDELGDAEGHGTAIASSDGQFPAMGREANLDQPFLSRDDEGLGRVGDAPSKYIGPTGSGAMAQAMLQPSAAESEPPASFRGRPLDPATPIQPPKAKTVDRPASAFDGERKQLAFRPPENKPEAEPDQPTTRPVEPVAATATPPSDLAGNAVAMNSGPSRATSSQQPGLPARSADPAPKSDSEIDPFSQSGSAELRAGKMVVRSGRKAKLTRPRLSLAGFWDGVGLGQAAVTMKLTIDPDGKVVRADVLRSSGSNEIDNPICLEAYNWWFEPNKNKAGEPVRTVIPFTVVVMR